VGIIIIIQMCYKLDFQAKCYCYAITFPQKTYIKKEEMDSIISKYIFAPSFERSSNDEIHHEKNHLT
jgi:hypothetical protein